MGDNIFLGDRNGVRTPMQWSPDRNAGFFARPTRSGSTAADHGPRSTATKSVNVEARRAIASSLLN